MKTNFITLGVMLQAGKILGSDSLKFKSEMSKKQSVWLWYILYCHVKKPTVISKPSLCSIFQFSTTFCSFKIWFYLQTHMQIFCEEVGYISFYLINPKAPLYTKIITIKESCISSCVGGSIVAAKRCFLEACLDTAVCLTHDLEALQTLVPSSVLAKRVMLVTSWSNLSIIRNRQDTMLILNWNLVIELAEKWKHGDVCFFFFFPVIVQNQLFAKFHG